MKKSRFSDEQKVKMLREAEATSVATVAKKHGISRETIYTWRRSFTGVDVKEARRLRELEKENARLKKFLVERDLEIEVMKEIAAKNGERGGTQAAGGVRAKSRPVEPSRLRFAWRCKVVVELRVTHGRSRPRAPNVPP